MVQAEAMDVSDAPVRVRIENLKLWKALFKAIKNVVDDVPIPLRVQKNGYVSLNTYDKGHVALLLLKMRCEVDGLEEEDDCVLVLNAIKLDVKLGMPKEQNEVSLSYFPDASIQNNLFLFEEESENCAAFNKYRLNLLSDNDIEEPGLPPDEEAFLFEIDFEMSILRDVLQNASSLDGETISFILSQSRTNSTEVINRLRVVVGLGGEDEFERCFHTIHDDAQDARHIQLDGPAMRGAQPVAEAPFVDKLDATFSVKQLFVFLKPLEPQQIRLGLAKNVPLKLIYPLDETGESYLHYYVSPRIRD